MLNYIPIVEPNQPSSRIRIGQQKIEPGTDVVEIIHQERRAHFYVDPVDDSIIDNIGNKVKINENVASIFGGIDETSDFIVDESATKRDIEICDSAKIYTNEIPPEDLEPFLKQNEYLLHEIEEVVPLDDGDDLASFTVAEMRPTGYTTLRVTDSTTIEFVGAGELREIESSRDERRTGSGGGKEGEDESVSVNLDPKKPTVNFEDDVAGLSEVKDTAEMLLALFNPDVRNKVIELYSDEFASRGNSMLMYGPPGCGKTLVSEAIAYEAKHNTNIEDDYGDVKFLEVKGSDVLSKYSGESEKRVEAIFEKAHGIAQEGFAVLFFDEVETLIPDRSDDSLQRHERSLTNAFLQEMNEVEDNLLVIGATNMPFTIDPAATRRFPIQQFIPQPDETVMAEVWRKKIGSIEQTGELDFERLGEASVGYTPAEIADRVLGSEFQRELVESVYQQDRDPIVPDTEYLLSQLEQTEPKTVRQYVASVRDQIDDLEGYPEMRRYVEAQAERLGIDLGGGPGPMEQLLGSDSGGDE